MTARILISMLAIFASACASNKPVLYPNAHSKSVSQTQMQADIVDCRNLATSAGAGTHHGKAETVAKRTTRGGAIGAATGVVGGAIAGRAGRGAAIGAASGATAGLIHSLLGDSPPNSTYRRFVTRCLADRGYEVVGWN